MSVSLKVVHDDTRNKAVQLNPRWMIRTITVIFILVLAGCTPPVQQTRESEVTPVTGPTFTVSELLRQADLADANEAISLRLAAAVLAFENNNAGQAQQILNLIPRRDVTVNTVEYLLLSAQVAVTNNLPAVALTFLNDKQLLSSTLNRDLQIKTGLLRSEAYRLNRSFIASVRERIYLDPLLTEMEQADNHDKIFETLLNVPAKSLGVQANEAITNELKGWLTLAAMTRQYQNNPDRQFQELNNWKKAWPQHPASVILPRSLTMLSGIVSDLPSTVGLILPFQGPNGSIGRAIRDGFLAARYVQQGSVSVIMYDASSGDVVDLVRQAELDGVELIVGPLAKDDVMQVASATSEVPILALNRTVDTILNPELYQFGLAPEDEIRQVVKQVHSEGLQNALVIFQDSEWGERNFLEFRTAWEALGGNIVDSAAFSSQRDYSGMIKTLLKVDRSELRSAELQKTIYRDFKFIPRRRQDIDFVFLLADPDQARGINPALERYYAEDVPVYATSHIHEFGQLWIEAIDLNRIRFCDIPWKLISSDNTQTRIQSAWSAAQGQLGPFFALGVDAYRLYPRLQQLKLIPSNRLFGTTGVLRLNSSNVVERELMWAQFRDGSPVTDVQQ